MAACDELTATAERLGAVNCIFWRDGKIVGDSTDGDGYVRGLHADLGLSVTGLRCVIVGAGGAAGAVAYALGVGGAEQVAVVNRTEAKAQAVASLAANKGKVGSVGDLVDADLVINATPIGMGSTELANDMPFDVGAVRPDAVVSDLIYHPAQTPLLVAAAERGMRTQNGLPMLVHQAVAAFEHWTTIKAPVEVMTAAVQANLGA